MKRTVKVKNLIAFTAVLILLISITVTPVYADFPPTSIFGRRFGAGLMSALLGLNITLQSTLAPYQQLLDYIAEPVNEVIEYTYPQTDWEDEIMNRSSIQIWKDYVTIDGVDYTDIWLSNNAAEKFRVNAFDFKTGYNLASNTEATFASGYGTIDGIPAYNVDQQGIRTQSLEVPAVVGYYTWGNGDVQIYNNGNGVALRPSTGNIKSFSRNKTNAPYYVWYSQGNPQQVVQGHVKDNGGEASQQMANNMIVNHSEFDFDYVSGTIPSDSPLPVDTGMMIRVPSTTINNYLENHPTFNVDTPVYLDFDLDPQLKVDIEDLFDDVIIPVVPILDFDDVNFTVNHDSPAPVIDNLLPDTYKQEILQPITQNFQQTQETIQNMGDTIVENIPKIDEICNNIDTAPYHDLDTGLDHLPTVFLPFITDLRSALGIWHYVTEWIGQISTTFAFVTGCLVGTSIMTPIYAAIAGFMCIKVYRRMTG